MRKKNVDVDPWESNYDVMGSVINPKFMESDEIALVCFVF